MRVLENAELKYTLEELLKKSAGAAHYSLCVVKYSVAIKRRSQNARGWILNLLEREPQAVLGKEALSFWRPVSREPWKLCSTVF